MNVPSVALGNWDWRLLPGQLTEELAEQLAEMPRLGGLAVEGARQESERRGRVVVAMAAPMPPPSETRDEARDDAGRAQVMVAAAG